MRNLLILSIAVLLKLSNCFAQETPKPEFFGIYAVINEELIEFKKENAVKLSGAGDIMNTTLGIRELQGQWFKDSNIYFITYGIESKPTLSTLTWKEAVTWKNSISGEMKSAEAKMYVADNNIEFKIAPVQGMQECYKYVPSKSLAEGYYCLHFGRLTSKEAMNMTVEANSNKDVFDFAITQGLKIKGELGSCSIEDGEYTLPPSYGLFLIENNEYVKIQVSRGGVKNIPEFGPLDERRRGLKDISNVELNSLKLEKMFISFSKENPRVGVKISISTADYKDMIPEKMFLSKLKQIEADTRSKREIKKLKPIELEKLWIEENDIPFKTVISGFVKPRIASLHIEKTLEPGVYAFHNGLLKGQSPTFGVDNIIYSFRV